MEKNVCVVDQNTLKELTKNLKILSIILVILGLVFSIVSFVEIVFLKKDIMYMMFAPGVFILTFGIMILISNNKSIKKMEGTSERREMEFFDDYFSMKIYKKEELVGESKTYYKDVQYMKESPNYIFLYIHQRQAYPFSKSEGLLEFFKNKGIKIK